MMIWFDLTWRDVVMLFPSSSKFLFLCLWVHTYSFLSWMILLDFISLTYWLHLVTFIFSTSVHVHAFYLPVFISYMRLWTIIDIIIWPLFCYFYHLPLTDWLMKNLHLEEVNGAGGNCQFSAWVGVRFLISIFFFFFLTIIISHTKHIQECFLCFNFLLLLLFWHCHPLVACIYLQYIYTPSRCLQDLFSMN